MGVQEAMQFTRLGHIVHVLIDTCHLHRKASRRISWGHQRRLRQSVQIFSDCKIDATRAARFLQYINFLSSYLESRIGKVTCEGIVSHIFVATRAVSFVVSALTVDVTFDFNFIPVFRALMRRNENEVESGMDVETRLVFCL